MDYLSYLPRDLLLLLDDYTSQAIVIKVEDVVEDDEGEDESLVDLYLRLHIGCGTNAFRFPISTTMYRVAGFISGKLSELSEANRKRDIIAIVRKDKEIRIGRYEGDSIYTFPPKQATLFLGKLRSLAEDYRSGKMKDEY